MKPNVLKINKDKPEPEQIKLAADCILQGGVVMFPADTCYGLAIDPTDNTAIDKLDAIKRRPKDKRYSMIFQSTEQIKKWASINARQENILRKNLPGPFTFLLAPSSNYPLKDNPHSGDRSIGMRVGVRIPLYPLTIELSRAVDIPYSATSANISSEPPCYSVEEFITQSSNFNLPLPDLILNAGALPRVEPSSVVDLTTDPPTIVRVGSGKLKTL